MSGFTKLDSGIVDSSIWDESPEVCKVWVSLLALSDHEGFVRGSAGWLAKKAKVPLDAVNRALSIFQEPDHASRNPANDGRRIKTVEKGWILLNHAEFRSFSYSQKPSAVRMRRLRSKPNSVTFCVTCDDPPSHSASVSVQGKGECEREGGSSRPSPTWEMVKGWLKVAKAGGADYTEAEARSAFLALNANGWMWGKNPVVDYRSAIERQIQTDRDRKPKPTAPPPHRPGQFQNVL